MTADRGLPNAELARQATNFYSRGLPPGVKRPGHVVDLSPPTIAEVKKMWIYTSTPIYAFMA
jgi:hypothetical protein